MWTFAHIETEHAEALHALETHPLIAPTLGTLTSRTVGSVKKRIESLVIERETLLGAFEDGALIGVASLEGRVPLRRRHEGALWLAVAPSHWRRGVGRSLLQELIHKADNYCGYVRLMLHVQESNVAAIALYESLGFAREVRREAMMFRSGYEASLQLARIRPGFVESAETSPLPVTRPRTKLPPAELTIRPAEVSDAEHFIRIHASLTNIEYTMQMPHTSVRKWREILTNNPPSTHSIVALHQGEVIGSAALIGMDSPRFKHVATLGIGVREDMQGSGAGDRLMSALTKLADEELGLIRIELDVSCHNTHAIRLYERHGFVKEGVMKQETYVRGQYRDSFAMGRVRRG
jgi:putative acetyltransferase